MDDQQSPWVFLGLPFEQIPEEADLFGFVYVIENMKNGKKYVGKKRFYFKGKKKVTLKNGKKKKKTIYLESDWRDYYGSSAEFCKEVEMYGKVNFKRTIIHLCSSPAECSYLEAHEQFRRNVLLDDKYSNGWIMVRVRKDHLKKFRDVMIHSMESNLP